VRVTRIKPLDSSGVKASDDFEVRLEKLSGDAAVVHVEGELDLATTPRLEETLQEGPLPATLVVDLGNCSFIDSSAIRLLTTTARQTAENGGRVALVATDPGILRVLEITAVDTMLAVHPTVDAALDA
jgi:anti-anti-sigma factor